MSGKRARQFRKLSKGDRVLYRIMKRVYKRGW